ncbi:MAG: hypothetical protein ACLFP2_04575 [Candidatus Woesearchaeota archaeon]
MKIPLALLLLILMTACAPSPDSIQKVSGNTDKEEIKTQEDLKKIKLTEVRGYIIDEFYRIEILMKLNGSEKVDMKGFSVQFNNESFEYPEYKIDFLEGDADDLLEKDELFMITFDPTPFKPGTRFDLSLKGKANASVSGTAPKPSDRMRMQLWP